MSATDHEGHKGMLVVSQDSFLASLPKKASCLWLLKTFCLIAHLSHCNRTESAQL